MVQNSIFTLGNDVRVSCLMNLQTVEHLREATSNMKTNLMATLDDYLYLAVGDCINAYRNPTFSAKTVPRADEIFLERPEFTLKPSSAQVDAFTSKMPNESERVRREFNHIRAGLLDGKPVMVAVGEFGMIFAWDLMKLPQRGQAIAADRSFFAPEPDSTWGIAFNAQSKILFISSNAHAISAFDYYSGECLFSDFEATVHEHNIPSLDSKGEWLLSAGIDQKCVLWNFSDPRNPKWYPRTVKVDEWGWLTRFIDAQPDVKLAAPEIKKSSFNADEDAEEEQSYDDEIGPIGFDLFDDDSDSDSYGSGYSYYTDYSFYSDDYSDEYSDEYDDYSDFDSDQDEDYDSDDCTDSDETTGPGPLDALNEADRLLQRLFEPDENDYGVTLVEGAENGWATESESEPEDKKRKLETDSYDSDSESDYDSYDDSESDYDSEDSNDIGSINAEDFRNRIESVGNSESEDSENEIDPVSDSKSEDSEDSIGDFFPCTVCLHPCNYEIYRPETFIECKSMPDSPWPPHVYLCSEFFTSFQSPSRTFIKEFDHLRSSCKEHFDNHWLSLLQRPSFGEWCSPLQLLLFADQSGFLYVTQMSASDAVALCVPHREPKSPLVGMAVRLVEDAEFGFKAHVFLLDYSGKLSIYEVSRLS